MAKLRREAPVKKLVSKQVLIATLRRKITDNDRVISKLRLMISKIFAALAKKLVSKQVLIAKRRMERFLQEVAGTKGLGTKGAGANMIRASAHEAIKPCTCYRTLVGDKLPCPWCNNLSKVRF